MELVQYFGYSKPVLTIFVSQVFAPLLATRMYERYAKLGGRWQGNLNVKDYRFG